MERQLEACQLPFVILEATDGSTHTFTPQDSTSLSQGELGCALSHRRALAEFLKTEADWALIMEDDIEIESSFPAALQHILQSLLYKKDKCIYVQFDYAPVGWKGVTLWWFLFVNMIQNQRTSIRFWLQLPVYLLKGTLASVFTLIEGMRDWRIRRHKTCKMASAYKDRYLAGCYLLSRPVAEKLITLNTPIIYAADAVHNIARKQRAVHHYICVPRLIRQKRETFNSTLNDVHFGKKIIAY